MERQTPGPTGPTPSGNDGSREDATAGATATDAPRPEDLQRQINELNDRLLRSAADYQNFVRRSQQNVVEARDQQVFDMAKALVNVLDHFDRALEVDAKATSAENVLQGIRMVRDEFLKTLNRFGVERIEAKPGEEFDPRRHEALMRQPAPAPGVASNHVAAQLQPGYTFGDRTVRPAKVSVAQ